MVVVSNRHIPLFVVRNSRLVYNTKLFTQRVTIRKTTPPAIRGGAQMNPLK